MSFLDIELKKKYRSSDDENIAKAFIEKTLTQACCYKRAVGFFSSSSLVYTSRGLAKIAEKYKGGEPLIKYIVSPRMTEKDVMAIKEGYKTREQVILESLERDFTDVSAEREKERLNLICHLISSGAMDIKIAVTEKNNELGMYHEKIGVFYDENFKRVAFEGSLNESLNAYMQNFESVRVYRDWLGESEDCDEIEKDFDSMWNNNTKNVRIFKFPNALKERLFKYQKEKINWKVIDGDEPQLGIDDRTIMNRPRIPENIKLHDYQQAAIKSWFAHHCRGIFDMATGTGKTYTAYGAIVKLLEQPKINYKMAVIVVCPYQHLVEQWVDDAPNFNIKNAIIGYSNSKYSNYLSKLQLAIQDYNDGIRDNLFFFCTNATFKLEKVQKALSLLKKPALLVADEAHNLGTNAFAPLLDNKYNFRLALSATIDRFGDETGTQQIKNFFGEKCIEYDLKRAILEEKLTKYYYYPIITTLSLKEMEEYKRLTDLIRKNSFPTNDGSTGLTSLGEKYAIERARLIAGTTDKIVKLREEMQKHTSDKNMLVYCGTSKLENDNETEIKQIDAVSQMLGFELNMNVGRYTSQENVEERKIIKDSFSKGYLQALVAIKCLDEGVNIPGIKTAFILASSTNPREYIQRRGRVLRRAPGKDYAYIYDFVTLPVALDEMHQYSENMYDDYKTLARNEVSRLREFGTLAVNSIDAMVIIDEITKKFGLNDFDIKDNFERIEWDKTAYE